jgi:nucleoside phosphorylase
MPNGDGTCTFHGSVDSIRIKGVGPVKLTGHEPFAGAPRVTLDGAWVGSSELSALVVERPEYLVPVGMNPSRLSPGGPFAPYDVTYRAGPPVVIDVGAGGWNGFIRGAVQGHPECASQTCDVSWSGPAKRVRLEAAPGGPATVLAGPFPLHGDALATEKPSVAEVTVQGAVGELTCTGSGRTDKLAGAQLIFRRGARGQLYVGALSLEGGRLTVGKIDAEEPGAMSKGESLTVEVVPEGTARESGVVMPAMLAGTGVLTATAAAGVAWAARQRRTQGPRRLLTPMPLAAEGTGAPAGDARGAEPGVAGDLGAFRRKVDFGIVTIREDEAEAVLERFPKMTVVEGRRRYRIRRLPLPDGSSYIIAALRCFEQGNTDALSAARDLLEDLDPAWILVVGIAGAVPSRDLTLGDVIVSTRIVDFSVEAVIKDQSREYALGGGPLHPDAAALAGDVRAMVVDGDLEGWNSAESLRLPPPPVDLAPANFYGDDDWQRSVRDALEHRFSGGVERKSRVVAGAIASSDRLVKDAEILGVWLKIARQVQAVEMESAGVYKAAHGRVPFLAIRGISDVVGFRRHPDWTAYACESAAAFMRALLLTRPVAPRAQAAGKPSAPNR